jgi:hypothetical protein
MAWYGALFYHYPTHSLFLAASSFWLTLLILSTVDRFHQLAFPEFNAETKRQPYPYAYFHCPSLSFVTHYFLPDQGRFQFLVLIDAPFPLQPNGESHALSKGKVCFLLSSSFLRSTFFPRRS